MARTRIRGSDPGRPLEETPEDQDRITNIHLAIVIGIGCIGAIGRVSALEEIAEE